MWGDDWIGRSTLLSGMKARTRYMRGRRNRLLGRCHRVQMMMRSQSDTYIPISLVLKKVSV